MLSILLVGFGYYTLFSSPASESARQSERTQEEYAVQPQSSGVTAEARPRQGTGTLDFLRLLNEDLECSIMLPGKDGDSDIEGTYFVSDGKMRGDFLTEGPDLSGQMLSSMILVGTTMHVWSEIDGELYGMKIDTASLQGGSVDAKEPVARDVDVSYDCKPWKNVDWTVFEPPSTVLFTDMNEMMNGMMEYGTLHEEGEGMRSQ